MIDPMLFYLIVAVVSMAILIKSADLLVYGISEYARKLGVSDFLIGFIVVSIGTALPELMAALTGAGLKEGGIVFGTIFGSNIFKIPLLGLVILIARRIKLEGNVIGNAPIVTLFLAALPVILVSDGSLSRVEGGILVIAFIAYIMKLWHNEGQIGRIKKDVDFKDIYKDGMVFCGSLVALLLSARWLVLSSLEISNMLNISPYIIGLVVIGIGASAPELTVQIRSMLKHHKDIALSNVLGSIIANSTLALGLTAIATPFTISFDIIMVTFIFMMIGIFLILNFLSKKELNIKHGLVLIAVYILFFIAEWLF